MFLFENPTSGTDGPQFSMYERGTANIKVRLSTHDDSYFNGGNVGIGTTSADAKLDVHGLGYFRTPAGGALISSWTTGASTQENQPVLLLRRADENNNAIALNSDGNSYFNGGNVGIGTTNPASTLHILGSFGAPATSNSIIRFAQSSGNGLCDLGFMAAGTNWGATWIQSRDSSSGNKYYLSLNPEGGNVGIGASSPVGTLHVTDLSVSIGNVTVTNTGTGVTGGTDLNTKISNGDRIKINGEIFTVSSVAATTLTLSGTPTTAGTFTAYTDTNALVVMSGGNVGIGTTSPNATLQVVGSVSKSSGSFRIDHPVKPETHDLVHSFVEAPQADNIYRGKVDLVAGKAEMNIDSVAGMTEGTFVLLNREIQVFTSNESDWDAVRGKVEGNKVIIECQNAESTATISWLVIGERQDKHMYDTEWTDADGKVIVEPLKPKPEPEYVEEEPVVEEALEEPVAEEAQPEEVATEEPQEVAQVSLGASISSTSLDDISNSRAEEL